MDCISNFLCAVYSETARHVPISAENAITPYKLFKEYVCSPLLPILFGNITGYKEFQDLTCSTAQNQITFAAFNEALSNAATCSMKTTAALIDLTICEIRAEATHPLHAYVGMAGMASIAAAWALDRYGYKSASNTLSCIGVGLGAVLLYGSTIKVSIKSN